MFITKRAMVCKHNKGIRRADFTFTSFANLPIFFYFLSIYPFGQLASHSFQFFVASNSCYNSCLSSRSDSSRCSGKFFSLLQCIMGNEFCWMSPSETLKTWMLLINILSLALLPSLLFAFRLTLRFKRWRASFSLA